MEIYLYLLLFLSFFLISKFLLSKRNTNLPPSPPGLPIIGHLHLFKKPLFRTLAQIANKYGPVLYLQFGSRPVLLVSSPSAAEDCFTKNNDIVFANRPRLLIGKLTGNDYTTMIWASYGPNWRNQRRISAIEILSANRVQTYTDIRLNEVKSLIRRLTSGHGEGYRTVELKSMLFDLNMNNMLMMIAGKRVYGDDLEEVKEAKKFQECLKEIFTVSGASNVGDFLPLLGWWQRLKGYDKRVLALKAKKDAYIQNLIDERRKTGSSRPKTQIDDGTKMTLIDVMLGLQENEPDYYTDEMLCGFFWVLFAAGIETSSGTIEWALSLLLNHPEVMKKAQAEIDEKVQGRLMDESDLNKLPYLHSIIAETLRIYPAGPLLIPHESSENCIVGGYDIPRGTMLMVNVWAMHNDPTIWPEPTKFIPERLSDIQGNRDGFKLMPFGSGRRGCPGEGLAMHVVGLTLGSLIQCFNWERVGPEMVDMTEGSGLSMPKLLPLEAKCKPRQTMLNFI